MLAAGLYPVEYDQVFGRLQLYDEEPFSVRPWAWLFSMRLGVAALGAALLAAVFEPALRRAWFAGFALVLAGGATWWSFQQHYPRLGMESIERFAFWRNGSELFEASPEYLDWAAEFGNYLETKPTYSRSAYQVDMRLGDYFLRIGRRHEAIQSVEEALARLETHKVQIESFKEGTYLQKKKEVLRWLAIANMRSGEIDHCIAMVNAESCIYPLHGAGQWADPTGARKAQEWLMQYLEIDPENPGARWLLNVVHMASGTFPEGVPEEFRLPPEAYETGVTAPSFKNVGPEVGVHQLSVAGGSIMEDFDNDGFLDLFATCLRQDTNCVFYHNNGDGTFSDWTGKVGLTGVTGGLSAVQSDYDNDGWVDILICRGAWLGDDGLIPNYLLHNKGDGSFEDVTSAAGMYEPAWPCLAAAWCDYDFDGDLDVYIGNERLRDREFAPSQLFRNDGNGTFTDVARQAGVENMRFSRGVCWGDYDNDGDWDLYVSNFGDLNRLYENRGDGTFQDVAPELGVAEQTGEAKKQRSFQSWFFDFNNDGWLDLFSASYPLAGTGGSVDGPAASMFGEAPREETCKLWINDGKGGFLDKTREFGLLKTVSVMGANIGDIDNDGWMDFYLATGAPAYEVFTPNLMLRNLGGTAVGDATVASGLGHFQKGHGVAFGDVDNDGDQDIYAQLGGWYTDDRYFNALFRNDGDAGANRRIALRLVGVKSNRFGVGALVKAVTLEGGKERAIYATVGTGASFGGNTLQLELGLGAAERLDRVEIRWPRAGSIAERTETVRGLPMDRTVEITESGAWREVAVQAIRIGTD
jgi:hypothetical protein